VSGQDLAILEVVTNPIYDCLFSNSGVEISRCVSFSIARTVHCVLGKAVRLVVSQKIEKGYRLQQLPTFTPASFAVTVHNQKSKTFQSYKPLKRLPDFA
jgi:hypothetical protein